MILWFALLGCPAAAPPEPAAAPPEPASSPAPATAPASDSVCVKACMDQRMMQAVSIDKIRSDCQVECNEAPKPPF